MSLHGAGGPECQLENHLLLPSPSNRHQSLGKTAAGSFLRPAPSFLNALYLVLPQSACYVVPSSVLPQISAQNQSLTRLMACYGLWLTHLVVLKDETRPNMLVSNSKPRASPRSGRQHPHLFSECNVGGDAFIISCAQNRHKLDEITSVYVSSLLSHG